MTAARKRFSQEFKDELCQEVIATSKPIREVAEAYGVGTETLRKWLNKYRHTHGGVCQGFWTNSGLIFLGFRPPSGWPEILGVSHWV